jgi:hypothetical protein
MAKREKRYSESEWLAITDLRQNWAAFCDADPFDGADTFIERMEVAGFIDMRTATKRDVEATSFADELGIVAGQPIWVLTKKGHAALETAK